MKEIAKDLAFGCSTSEVAEKHGVTAGRISQLRSCTGSGGVTDGLPIKSLTMELSLKVRA